MPDAVPAAARRLAGAVLAAVGLAVGLAGALAPAGEARPPGARAQAAPAVMHRDTAKVEPHQRKDRRSVETGLEVVDGYAFVWGLADEGASGGPTSSIEQQEFLNFAPALVEGLPQGAIVDMAAGSHDFNAIDTQGCVWGWGWWGTRNGTGQQRDLLGPNYSTPPRQVQIGGHWDEGGQTNAHGQQVVPLCAIRELSMSDMAGAGIREDGTIWSWGANQYGGPQPDDASPNLRAYIGAQPVADLPSIDDDPSNRPVQLEGGFATFWVVLANGDVWYFGGGDDGFLTDWERPAKDQPQTNSGYADPSQPDARQPRPNMRDKERRPVRAARSKSLEPWFRRNSPEEYIVQVHSGIGFGAALLSTGRVLTWGQDPDTWAALGRTCDQKRLSQAWYGCARTPAYAALPAGTGSAGGVVGLSCGYTATVVLTGQGELWAWGMPATAYEDRAALKAAGTLPTRLAANVARFQPGEGYILWWTMDGRMRGVGYNPRGALGAHAGNYGDSAFVNETKERPVWFARQPYMWCTYWDDQQNPPGEGANALPPGWRKGAGGNWYDASGQMVYIGGATTEYTSGEVIRYKTWDKWPCADLNDASNRLSWDYCVQESIRLEQTLGQADGRYRRPCG
ncbi:MAG: hypothetical protein LBD51_04645 [Bifidobacteriaceae bacterium]|jgi:hypothetical protein|nr:hypothetical protein [Bifidobacteriaceae bacterium]